MYTLVYHEHLAFRAAPIQMLLLDAEAEFKMAPPEWGEDRVVATNPGCAVFAPPVLRKGDFTLGQTTAIMDYLGRTHGMLKGSAEQLATANQLTLDVADIGSELFGLAKDAEKKAAFAQNDPDGRLFKWLAHVGKVHARHEGPFLLTVEQPTPADFMLCSMFEALDFALGAAAVKLITPATLQAWRATVQARPFFAKFMAIGKPQLFPSMKFEA